MHEPFLLKALDEALLGRGVCAPNPSVGAVAVHKGQIIAQSWHRGAGTPHAEQLLLAQLPQNISEITLYVTLEPCNHWGKTPPCVDAIIRHGIKTVVYAYADPNPIIEMNNTPQLLRDQGIDVIHYPLFAIDAFYQSYRHWTLTHRPWVTIKMAQTLDGMIAGERGVRVQLSNELCAEFTHKKRLDSDVILTTARTVNMDNPRLNARVKGIDVAKPLAIIDSGLLINHDASIFNTSKHIHFYHDEQYEAPLARDHCSYHAMPAKNGTIDLHAVIQHLGSLGYHDVWVEAGGTLFNALHEARLVNRTYLYIVPMVLGDAAVSAYRWANIFNSLHQVAWHPMGDNMIASLVWSVDEPEALCLQE